MQWRQLVFMINHPRCELSPRLSRRQLRGRAQARRAARAARAPEAQAEAAVLSRYACGTRHVRPGTPGCNAGRRMARGNRPAREPHQRGPQILRAYLQATRCDPKRVRRRYPGSPLLALGALRDIDRVASRRTANRGSSRRSKQAMPGRRDTAVVCGDGYAALKTYLPPRENRGLVLIDPPYEAENEFAVVERALQFGLTRWPNGVFAAGIRSRRDANLSGCMRRCRLRACASCCCWS